MLGFPLSLKKYLENYQFLISSKLKCFDQILMYDCLAKMNQ